MSFINELPYDILCYTSNFFNTEEVLNFRLISEIFDRVFREYWLFNNDFVLKDLTLILISPEWFKNTRLILSGCIINVNILMNLPDGSLVKDNTNICCPIMNTLYPLRENHLDNLDKHYGVKLNIRLCSCCKNQFCGNDYCSSLIFWIPEYQDAIRNNTNIIPEPKDIDDYICQLIIVPYSHGRTILIGSFIDFFSKSDLSTNWCMFLLNIFFLRNHNNIAERKSYKHKLIYMNEIQYYVLNNIETEVETKFKVFFEHFSIILQNIE